VDIPSNPYKKYKGKGWESWGDWLGTGNVHSKNFRSFKEARDFARSLDLKNCQDWYKFSKSGNRPDDIPVNPSSGYKNKGWNGWGDFLGTGNVAPSDMVFREFKEARKFARSLDLKNCEDWYKFSKSDKLPDDIPASPVNHYANKGWKGMGDWLGTGNVAPSDRVFMEFKQARKFARSLKLKGSQDWYKFAKDINRPVDIPSNPHKKYKGKGWESWGDWLGTGNVHSKNFRSFKEARKFARSLDLKNSVDWTEFSKSGKRPDDIPGRPNKLYKDKGWVSWDDFLGASK
jgi:hypothetical protein